MISINNSDLTEDHREIFIEVIEKSLLVKSKPDLFNLLQHGIQNLIAHDVMIYGVSSYRNEQYDFNYFSTTLDFNDLSFEQHVLDKAGLIHSIIGKWQDSKKVVLCSNEFRENEFPQYSIVNVDASCEFAAELKDFVIHGFEDPRSNIKTIVIFAHLKPPVNCLITYILDLLMPTLHCALLKANDQRFSKQSFFNRELIPQNITKREIEVLQWLNIGKTNWEISEILDIIPTTVKNHVQNIIRKLGVENRNQAAKKGLSLGLIEHTLPK